MSKSGFFWNDKKSRLSLIIEQRFRNTSSRPIMTEEVSKSWVKLSSLNDENFIVLIKEANNIDEINNFFVNIYWNKIGIFVKLMRKVSMRWKNWSDFKVLHSIQFQEEDWSEIEDTILELTARIQELQNGVNFLNDSGDVQDAESVRSGQSHVTSQSVFFPPHPDPGGMLSRSIGMPSRNDGPPSIWDTHGISGNVFANPTASSSAPYPQELNPWGARRMGFLRHAQIRRRRTRKGPNLRVCKHLLAGVAHAGEEGWINILPWYRLVGVAKSSSETQRRKSRAAQKG